jgi:cytochrome c oxidase assembly factor CtaG
MNKRMLSPGIYGLGLLFLLGIWLVVAPFATQTQPVEGSWQLATINDVAAGGVLILVSLLGGLISVALALREAVLEKEYQEEHENGETAGV